MAHIYEDTQRTTPIGLARYAREFHKAAMGADDTLGTEEGYEILAPVPVLYLIGHSMELALKAYLVHNGVSLRDLRLEFKHDLSKCFSTCETFGLTKDVAFDQHELAAFAVLNDLYSTKQLEYIVTGAKTFPIFGHLHTMSEKLLSAVCLTVGYHR